MSLRYCRKCVVPSTRPRITFDEEGICNACRNAENKQRTIDYKKRGEELEGLCDKHRSKDGSFDCIVPCSGGKDGDVVAGRIKDAMGMHPLCITLQPQLPTEIGRRNLDSFRNSGFDHLLITADPEKDMKVSRWGFIERGQPKLSALIGQTTALSTIAVRLNIPVVVWGEEGESEYGGVTHMVNKTHFSREERIAYYFEGIDPEEVARKANLNAREMVWWKFPSDEELERLGLLSLFWSYFEKWNPYEHYFYAKKRCGFAALPTRSIGTYTNFAQLDDDMEDLHKYTMYLKFGFGRATSDACIDIRRGALDRKQAVALVNRYDGEYPQALIPRYLDYFKMTKEEFDSVIDKLANKDVLEKVKGYWRKKYPLTNI